MTKKPIRTFLAITSALTALAATGFAQAQCVSGPGDPSKFSLLIDATSECAKLSSDPAMGGCLINPATLSCTAGNLSVSLTAGGPGSTAAIDWIATGSDQVDFVIVQGATGGGTCGYSYEPGADAGFGLAFKKSNDSNQKVGDIWFCSDGTTLPPPPPKLSLSKTAAASGDDCPGAELLSIGIGESVKFCYEVVNSGGSSALNLVLTDDNGTDTPGDDFSVTLTGLTDEDGDGGMDDLAVGATAEGVSAVNTLNTAGVMVNLATVSSDQAADSDTATISVALPPPELLPDCPQDIQEALNDGTIPGDYAIVGQISDADSVTLCIKEDFQITVTECVNQEGTGSLPPPSSGEPLCSEGPFLNGEFQGAQPLMRDITFLMSKVGEASCVYTCVPPPLTLGGNQRCGYICK